MNTSKFYKVITENKALMDISVYEELLAMVNEEIAKEAEKSAGRKPNVRNAVKKFLSADDSRPILKRANVMDIDGVTYYGYCDGFKLAWSPIDFGFGVNTPEESLKFDKILDINYRGEKGIIPITKEFKASIISTLKTAHTRYRVPFDIDCGNGHTVRVNADYLKSCIDFTEADEIIVDMGSDANPLVLHGKENRNALLLPIRK